jgi:hypothetical protein
VEGPPRAVHPGISVSLAVARESPRATLQEEHREVHREVRQNFPEAIQAVCQVVSLESRAHRRFSQRTPHVCRCSAKEILPSYETRCERSSSAGPRSGTSAQSPLTPLAKELS